MTIIDTRASALAAALGLLAPLGCGAHEDPPGASESSDSDSDGASEDSAGESDTGEAEFECPSSDAPIPDDLCEWGLFEGDGSSQTPVDGVWPYIVVSNLFTDDAQKHRFIALPEGQTIAYDPLERWTFPLGTIIAKSFAYPVDARDPSLGERLVETRLLVLEDEGWDVHVYAWDYPEEGPPRATRLVPGKRLDVAWIDGEGQLREHEYRIPGVEDCKVCHGGKLQVDVLGLRTRQLQRQVERDGVSVDQIDWLTQLGAFDLTPEPVDQRQALADPYGDAALVPRARSYLDANCAHCHRLDGDAQSSGLWLNWENEDALHLGVCKIPVAVGNGGGGLDYDIVPGAPDESIMVFRMLSVEPDIKMPELGGLHVDEDGAALISDWIAAMEPPGCTVAP